MANPRPPSRAELERMEPVEAMRLCCSIPRPFTALHGRVGVVRNQHLITSPNAAWVPSIQWQNCQVSLCQDMRFGIDDYVLWPQWYQEKFPYLPAIPRPPTRGEESPFWRMWYSPCKGDFSATEGSADGKRPGYIHKGFAEELEALRAGLSDEVEHILSGLLAAQDHTNTAASFGAALARVRHAWVILSSWAGTFDEKRLEFAEWQRAWLELKGMCNYQRWNADRVLNPTHAPRAFVENCIGCVTDKPLIALSFFEMGIPVWLVRDKMSVLLGDTFIERPSTQVIRPGDHGEVICLQRDPTFPIIYGESPQLLAHYHVQQQFSRIRAVIHRVSPTGTVVHKGIPHAMMTRQDAKSVLISLRDMRAQPATETKRIANAPFSSTVSTPSAYAASSSHTPALSGRRDRRMRPYGAGVPAASKPWRPDFSTPKANDSIDALFIEKDGPGEPYLIAEWGHALARVDRTRPAGEKKAPIHLYTFPPPRNFAGSNTQRSTKFFESWLHIRHHWIGQVRSNAPGREIAVKGQTWRDMLRFGLGGPQPAVPKGLAMATIQKEMAHYALQVSDDGRVVTFDNGERLYAQPSRVSGLPLVHTVSWQDTLYNFAQDGVPEHVKRQVLWELHELNFRYDLIRLDQFLTPDGGDDAEAMMDRQDRLLKCWGTPSEYFYAPSHIIWSSRNKGLAGNAVEDRLSSIRFLYDLCKAWPQFPMPHNMPRINSSLTVGEASQLERDLYAALQQTFFDLFARPMVSPRRLHSVR